MDDATESQSTDIRNEMAAQALVRLAICSFMGLYYFIFGITNHPVYLLFIAYTATMLAIPRIKASFSHLGPLITLVIDNGFSICGLHVTGERGAFLLFFLVHISFAYTVRFGWRYLPVSLAIGCSGVTWLYFASEPWQGHIHFLLSFLFGMPFISIYVLSLTMRLKKSEAQTRHSNERTTRLLAFLTHDVRAPLQYIGEAASILERESQSPRGALAVEAIKSMAEFMARMVTRTLAESHISAKHDIASIMAKPDRNFVPILPWIVGFVEMYRAAAQSRGAVLQYEFEGQVDSIAVNYLTPVERILANVFSNALRYCESGLISVAVVRPNPYEGRVRIEVRNRTCRSGSNKIVIGGGEPSQTEYLYGTGLGLVAARDAAQNIGASFSFYQDNDLYVSVLDLVLDPNQLPSATSREGSTVYPVVIFARTRESFKAISKSLVDIANTYWIRSPNAVTGYLYDYTLKPAAVFIAHEERAPTEFGEGMSLSGKAVIVQMDCNLTNDTINYNGAAISIPIAATARTLRRSVQLAGSILRKSAEPQVAWQRHGNMLSEMRIIALDDNIVSLSILSARLRRFGINVSTVGSLPEATREIAKNRYDVFVLDWNIGAMTAEKLLKTLLSDQSKADLRFIVLSAGFIDIESVPIQHEQRIRRLTKPVADELLFETIIELTGAEISKSPTEFTNFPPAIFNQSAYLDDDSKPVETKLIKSLLTSFLAEASNSVAQLEKITQSDEFEGSEVDAHKIASMCYSAGAYALGDQYKELHSCVTAYDAGGSKKLIYSHISAIRSTFKFTNAHMKWFMDSLDSFSESENVNYSNL